MSEKVRVGILGAGWAGGAHAAAFARLPNVEISALWSRTRSRAEALAGQLNEPGLTVYADWRALIEEAQVDVISLATPPTLRREPLIMALERGCHVLVEKPVTVGLTDAAAMSQAASETDAITATAFTWRYAPGNQAAKRAIAAGQIGNVLDLHLEWRAVGNPREVFEQRPWVANFEIGDGPLGEALAHDFDRIRFLTGHEFTYVVSRLATRALPLAPDLKIDGGTSIVLAELTQDVLAEMRITLTAGLPEWRLVINGEQATLDVTHQATTQQRFNEEQTTTLENLPAEGAPAETGLLQHCWNRLIADFVTAIRRGDKVHATVPNLPTLADGIKAQQIISAARRSENERRWVAVEDVI